MKLLYGQAFKSLYKSSHKKLKDDKRKEVNVHFSKLYRAPPVTNIYWGLIEERLKALTNQAWINPRYIGIDRKIIVLPLKRGLYGSNKALEFYISPPEKHQIKNSNHFYITRGQHIVYFYINLIEGGEIDEGHKAMASTFFIILVWVPKIDHIKLMLLLHILNEDMVGPQKEQTFMMQLINA